MDSKMKFVNYKKVEATLEITMTIEEWFALREQLTSSWPSWVLGRDIGNMISKIQQEFRPDKQEKK